jgi:hypothetical protein
MTDKFRNYNINLIPRRFPGMFGIYGWYISFYDNADDILNDNRYGLADSSYKKRLGPLYFKPDETLDDKRTYGLSPIPFKNLDPDLQKAIQSFYDTEKKLNPEIQRYVSSNGSKGGKKSKKSRKPVKKQRKTRKHKK